MSTQDFNDFSQKSVSSIQTKTSSFKETLKNKNLKVSLPKNVDKKYLIGGGVIALLLVTFLAGWFISPNSTLGAKDERTEAPEALATQALNKEFKFPLKDDKGAEVAKINYLVQSANLQDSFIYQGKVAKSVKGRTFLIFDLKITNPYSKTIEINAKDYVRVRVNGKDEQLAPEIHNDPVQIQANSTKYTRIGLPINDTDKNIILLVGELAGKKEEVKLNLSR